MYEAREVWLSKALDQLRRHFAACGYKVPEKVRVSCGLPSSRAFASKRSIGEAWASTTTRDQHFEIFVSPTIDDAPVVLATLVHELVHVTVGLEAGHRGKFQACAAAVGLMGPWTATKANDMLAGVLLYVAESLGRYPHGSLDKMTNARKKQKVRLLKVGCPSCGYTTRITRMWTLIAVPVCPVEGCERQGQPFDVELPEEIEEPLEVAIVDDRKTGGRLPIRRGE